LEAPLEVPHIATQHRLELLVRAGEIFHDSLELDATLENVARLAIERFADLCIFDLIDERTERLYVTTAAHRDPAREQTLRNMATTFYTQEFRVHPVVEATATGVPFFAPEMNELNYRSFAASREHERYMRELGYRSKIVVPVTARGKIFGALTFVRTQNNVVAFTREDLSLAVELGRRAGQAVANAKQFDRERHVADTLQRAFLPKAFPRQAEFSVSAHYRPALMEAAIGGDWYDAFERRNGEIVFAIGDVTGKGVQAAQLMVTLRQAIRIAALSSADPALILKTCNDLLVEGKSDQYASAFVGVLGSDATQLCYASAGHPPPYLRLPNDVLVRLENPSPPLGSKQDFECQRFSRRMERGSMLVLYTDGLVEATRDPIAGEDMLERVLRPEAIVRSANPALFIGRAVAGAAPHDDIAVMVLTFGSAPVQWSFEASDARSALAMRDDFFYFLKERCEASDAELTTCALVYAELIANAERHAPGPLSVSLEFRDKSVFLHFIDEGPGFAYEPSLPVDLWAESQRGLYLISKFSRSLSIERLPGLGTHVAIGLPVRCLSESAVEAG
jgi:serine phosphatase RsbU (regulator of sigma subunit)/anti-sigma regulatory factor (Ser/Thr protein kinase)